MNSICIIGIGSPFGTDRIGWQVAAKLSAQDFSTQFAPGEVTIFPHETPTSMLLLANDVETLLLIDVIANNLMPGEIRQISLNTLASQHDPWSSHGLGLKEMLEVLPNPPDHIIIFAIGIPPNSTVELDTSEVNRLTNILVPLIEIAIRNIKNDQ